MTASILEYEVRARLYFYLGFHRYGVRRWLDSLSLQNSTYNQELGESINDAFQYLISPSILENHTANDQVYRGKLVELSHGIRMLLQLVRYH
jgi:hypothetical protein